MHDLAISILKDAELAEEAAIKKHSEILNDIRASITVLLNTAASGNNTPQINGTTLKQSNGIGVGNRIEVTQIALEAIRKEGKFLHKRQIEKITGLENVSPTLSFVKTRDRDGLVSYIPGTTRNQTVWGFKDWLDDNGKPKPEHMFDEAFVMAIK